MKADINNMKTDINNMKAEMQDVKTDIINMKAEIKDINIHISKIDTRLDRMEETIQNNYSLTEKFFVSQMESNTEFRENIRIINGRLDKYDTQIARIPKQAKSL